MKNDHERFVDIFFEMSFAYIKNQSEVLREVLGEVFTQHLTCLKRSEHRCFMAVEGGGEVFLLFYKTVRLIKN